MGKKAVDPGLPDINGIDCEVSDDLKKNPLLLLLFCFESCFDDFLICKDIYVSKKTKD